LTIAQRLAEKFNLSLVILFNEKNQAIATITLERCFSAHLIQYLMDKFRTHFSAAQRVNDMDVSHKKESLAKMNSSQKLLCESRAG
jgi:hypothetical protein